MHSSLARLTVALATAAAAGPVAAAPRISIGAIQGQSGALLSTRLSDALCDIYDCVPRKKVTTGGRVDFAKMDAEKVSGFLLGSVIRKGSNPSLWLALVRDS